jgi:ribosomal protein S18 acetylase RimI-like enzyme
VDSNPGTPSYSLRPAVPVDSDFIYAVRVAGLKDYVAQNWGWDESFQAARSRASFNAENYQIIVVDSRDVGALWVESRENELFLADIEILPEWRGRGLGTSIIRDLLGRARVLGRPVSLQVLKINPARRLYERLGFSVVGETETHYLMSTNLRWPDW